MHNNSIGQAILVVGATGTGKTSFIRDRIQKVPPELIRVYDVQNDYPDITGGMPLPFYKDFMKMIKDETKKIIIIEECTIFFSNKGTNEELTHLLVSKRHTGNIIYLVYHSIRAVPRYVFDLINYIVLFKTNDDTKYYARSLKSQKIVELVEKVQKHPNPHHSEIFKLHGNVLGK